MASYKIIGSVFFDAGNQINKYGSTGNTYGKLATDIYKSLEVINKCLLAVVGPWWLIEELQTSIQCENDT